MRKKINSFRLTLDEKDQVPALVIVVITSICVGGIIAMLTN